MPELNMGPIWPDLEIKGTGLRFQPFPASAPEETVGEVHTAAVQSISHAREQYGRERLELTLANGPYSCRIFYDLDCCELVVGIGPRGEHEIDPKQMRKLSKLKKVASLLGLVTATGLDLSAAKLRAATGLLLKISVKDSGQTYTAKNQVVYPRLYVDVLGSAATLDPVKERKAAVKADPEADEWDIPF